MGAVQPGDRRGPAHAALHGLDEPGGEADEHAGGARRGGADADADARRAVSIVDECQARFDRRAS